MRILVTGATGFVGRVLCERLLESGHDVVAAVRCQSPSLPKDALQVMVGEIGPETHWERALRGVDAVVHLAARVHVMADSARDPFAEFRRVNVAGSESLALAAAQAGVRRVVYVSSVKVHGEETFSNSYSESDSADPQDAYGQSKWEAEQALNRVAGNADLEVVILRPPLVYGPGVGANFQRLIKSVALGMPLPLGCVRNRRSLVYLGNLTSALEACLTHPAAAGKTYLVSDGEDVSTVELIRRIASAMGRTAYLLPVPVPMLRMLGSLLGRSQDIDRLLGSLVVDSSKIRRELGWSPPFNMSEGLRQTIDSYSMNGRRHA